MQVPQEDWNKILTKLEFLLNYDSGDGILIEYVNKIKIKIIINEFIECFNNNVDVNFWNRIMSLSEETRKSSGGDYTMNWIDGWILHFFGIYKKTEIDCIPNYTISVPIKLINELTGIEKNLILGGGFVGITKIDEHTYKPNLALSITNEKLFNNDNDNYHYYY